MQLPRSALDWLLALVESGFWLLLLTGATLWLRGALRPRARHAPAAPPPEARPLVTVQLPLRNERTVVERLLEEVAALDWPRDRLQIQVLDDSDDDTVQVVDAAVAALVARGVPVEVVRRGDRRGFKAGALQAALASARGDFFLLLDADSRPPRALIQDLLAPLVHDATLGFAEARWSFDNEDASLLTRVAGLVLHGHFAVEQAGASAAGAPVQLNGTAALVRRRALEAAGGWVRAAGDASLTEDLELATKMLAHGYRGVMLADVVVGTELPETMAAWRAQQTRWVRGAGEVMRANLGQGSAALLRALLRHARHPAMVVTFALLPLRPLGLAGGPWLPWAWTASLSLLTLAALVYYGVALARVGRSPLAALVRVPALFMLSCGSCLSQTLALARGLLARQPGEFVRTPKLGDARRPRYRARTSTLAWVELIAGVAFVGVAAWSLRAPSLAALPSALALGGLVGGGLLWVGGGTLLSR